MSGWSHLPKPEGVGDITETADGFEVSIAVPVGDDGYFGRECPSCDAPFKMHADEYDALPDDLELTCPYCGHRDEHSEFMSSAQHARVMAAADGLAEQWLHGVFGDMLSETFGRGSSSSSGSGFSIEVQYTPGTPPPIRELPSVAEERTRRIIECSTCGNHHAVYSSTSFCPVCGPRPAAEKVLEAIAAARAALAVEDSLGEEERESLRSAGVFERFAVDAIESSVSLFESFARDQFARRVEDPGEKTAGKGNIFQRLDDTAQLFVTFAGIDLVELAGDERWARLKHAFARRHVLTHNGGIVDQRFLDRVPDTPLRLGQRLVIRRSDAEDALTDLEDIVRSLGAA